MPTILKPIKGGHSIINKILLFIKILMKKLK